MSYFIVQNAFCFQVKSIYFNEVQICAGKVNLSQAKLYKILDQKKYHWREKKVKSKASCLGWVGGEHEIKVNSAQLEPTCSK